MGRGNIRIHPGFFKKISNSFIKIEPEQPIKGGMGWVPEKTRPIIIPKQSKGNPRSFFW